MLCTLVYICILGIYIQCSSSIQFAEFIQTTVMEKDFDPNIMERGQAISPTVCVSKCSEEAECRRALFCKTGQLCWLYLDGTHCISPLTTTSDCVCFQKEIGCSANGACTCPWGQFGPHCKEYITDCTDGKNRNIIAPGGKSEIRTNIKPKSAIEPFEVTCYFNSGQVELLDRDKTANIIDFNRSLAEYEEGFGDNLRMKWIGLTKIRQILSNDNSMFRLRVIYVQSNGSYCYSIYSSFNIGPAPNYELSITYLSKHSTCGDSLVGLTGKPFSTYDRDLTTNKCSNEVGGGWWYKDDINGCSDTKGVLTAMPEAFWRNDMNNDKPQRVKLLLRRFV